jgi:fermentation-respiration switch protein FrsA (DUF1100 family)
MKYRYLIIAALLLSGCSLDSFLYNQQSLDHYEFSTAVIPEANRRIVTLDSEGHTLYGCYVWRDDSLDTGYTVLYCEGNKHNMEEYWDRVELFYQMGLRCFLFDYRGFGMSGGDPSASGLAADGRAALRFVTDSLRVDTLHLILYGYSLGNAVSIELAANVVHPYRLIAEAPFASAEALLRNSTPLDLPGGFVIDDNLNNGERIKLNRAPLLLLHGDRDDFIPYPENGRVVYENAPQPKQLVLVHGANHTDIPGVMGAENYMNRVLSFLALPE